MNVKKMFASLTGVLMLATTVSPLVTGAATYSDELQGAYDYAYSKGITTMGSIDNANMYGDLTRGQLAKMISQWAEKEMGVKADETAVCSFTDADTAQGDLASYLKKACQMGLMGQGIEKFRPNDKVTRGEFGTTLSRAIWGDKYDGENPFYAKHLQALKDAGIMNNISDPNATEMRGWVMLMLQRAAETVNPSECNDPAVLLACGLGSDACPAKCLAKEKDNQDQNPNNAFDGVIAGDLNIAVSNSSSTVSIPNEGIVKVAELTVKASEEIQLQSLDVTRLGLSKNEGIKVWIEKDGRRITSSSSFFGDSKANLTFNNGGFVVKGDEVFDLVVSFEKNKVAAGSEIQFKVSNVVSSAKNVTVSPDTTGNFRTAVYNATSIDIVSSSDTNTYAGGVSTANNPRTYNLSKDTTFSFGEIKVQNESSASMEKNVLIKSITFKVEGPIENLSNFRLLRDSKEVSSKYTIDGKSLTFAVNDQLDSGKAATYKVTAEPTNIESAAGDEYTLTIKKAEDIIAEEIGDNATAYRVSVTESYYGAAWGFSATDWDVVSLGTTKISGGNITLTKDSSLASTVSADWGYSDVVAAKGTIKVNQAVKFDGAKITVATVAGIPGALDKVIRRAALVIDGKSFQLSVPSTNFAGGTAADTDLTTNSEIYLSKGSHNVELQISLANTDPSAGLIKKVTFNAIDNNSFGTANYTNGDETSFNKATSIAGNIRIADINIAQKTLNIKKTGPSEDVNVAKGNTDEKVLLVGQITNNEEKALEVNKFTLVGTYQNTTNAVSVANLGDVYAILGDSTSSMYKVNTKTLTAGAANTAGDITDVVIDSLTTTVEPGKTVKFEIRYIPNASLTNTNVRPFKFAVTTAGKLDGNDTTSSSLNSAKVTVTAGATDSVVANTTDNKLIVKPGESVKVASFNYNVKNDSQDVNSITFEVDGFGADDLDDLSIDFGGSVGAPGLTYAYAAATAAVNYTQAEADAYNAALAGAVAAGDTVPGDYATKVGSAAVGTTLTAAEANSYNATLAGAVTTATVKTPAASATVTATFPNVVTLPVANYKVSVYATFNDSAIDTTLGVGTAQPAKEIKKVTIDDTGKFATLTFRHFVAKAYPILSVKDKNTSTDNARLDISVVKSNDNANTVKLTDIYKDLTTAASQIANWHVVDGSDTTIANNSIDHNTALVIGSSKAVEVSPKEAQKNIAGIQFTVTDDEGNTVMYDHVNAGSDFASLSL